jgi:hypothetical protein
MSRTMEEMKFTCCICHKDVQRGQPDTYTIQVSEPAGWGVQANPGLMWAHGPCLRDKIPVATTKFPN